jgi:hypothetical protein
MHLLRGTEMISVKQFSVTALATFVLAGTALAATTISNGTYAAHTKFEATNGGYVSCGGGYDIQFSVSDGNIVSLGHSAPIKDDGSFEFHYPLNPSINTNITGKVSETSVSGQQVNVGRTTTCTFSFTGARKS